MGQACNNFGEKKFIQYSGARSEGQTLLGTHIPINEDNINMDLKERGQGSVDCILLVQNREKWQISVSKTENIWVPFNADNFLSAYGNIVFL